MSPLLGAVYTVSSLFVALTIGNVATVAFAVVAAASLVGAIYGVKMKSALRAAESEASAWKGERDAAVAKAERMETALRVAEARTNITRVETLITDQHKESLAILSAVKDTLQILAARG